MKSPVIGTIIIVLLCVVVPPVVGISQYVYKSIKNDPSYYIYEYKEEIEKAYALKANHPDLTSFDGYAEPSIPYGEIRKGVQEEILGVDANDNGIRDDVEIWINRTQEGADFRNALRQQAKEFQEIMVSAVNDRERTMVHRDHMNFVEKKGYGRRCVSTFFNNAQDDIQFSALFLKILAQGHHQRTLKYQAVISQAREEGLNKEEARKKYCKNL